MNNTADKTKSFYNTAIPSEWEVKRFGSVCKKLLDGTHFSPKTKDGPFKYVTSKNIRNEGLDLVNIGYISEKEHREIFKRCPVQYGDILLTKDGASTGACCKNTLIEEFSLLSSVALLRTDSIKMINEYLLQFIKSPIGQKIIQDEISGQAITRITLEKIRSFKITIPPLPEQFAIAHVLCLMDANINKNNQLIAQKELQKKWMMQNLLTGNKRLKGFEGEWKEIHIRDVTKEVSLKNRTDKQLTVLSCTKYDGLVQSLEYWGRKIFADDISTYKIVPQRHFAYATNHIEEGSIGYQDILDEALISPMYTVFKTDSSINDTFFYKLLKSHMLIYQYQNRMEGSIDRRGGLRWDAFSIIKIHIPSYKEQTAIAQVLQAADKEIQLLKEKTEKLREQKRGMMQVLLTGKKRLKVSESEFTENV
jgi:type I restriction enzyme, S subunit